jgi:hypothetical protein
MKSLEEEKEIGEFITKCHQGNITLEYVIGSIYYYYEHPTGKWYAVAFSCVDKFPLFITELTQEELEKELRENLTSEKFHIII